MYSIVRYREDSMDYRQENEFNTSIIEKNNSRTHYCEEKINKMRVKYATQVLSGMVASCIKTLTRSKCK